jgi:hypothetical protein
LRAVDSVDKGNTNDATGVLHMKIQTLLIGYSRCRAAVRGAGLIAPLLLGMGFMQPASAGCLDVPGLKVPSADPGKSESRFGTARIIKVDFKEYADDEDRHDAPIVGLWAFQYTSEGNMETLGIPDGTPIDNGDTTWYADGNEITYSGARNPIVGAFCSGVWKRTGENTYVLNHIGLSWNPLAASISPPADPGPAGPGNPGGGPGAPGGAAFIKQYVTLSADHQSYTGTFSINQLLPDGKTPALPAPIKGTITATRITITTDTLP